MFIGRMQIKQLCAHTEAMLQQQRQCATVAVRGVRYKVITIFADMNFLNNNAVFNKKLLAHSREEQHTPKKLCVKRPQTMATTMMSVKVEFFSSFMFSCWHNKHD